jgi:hypothetical protein
VAALGRQITRASELSIFGFAFDAFDDVGRRGAGWGGVGRGLHDIRNGNKMPSEKWPRLGRRAPNNVTCVSSIGPPAIIPWKMNMKNEYSCFARTDGFAHFGLCPFVSSPPNIPKLHFRALLTKPPAPDSATLYT